MFDGLFGWLTEFDGKLSVFFIPLTETKTGLDWSNISSNLIGAVATIIAAFLAFWLGIRAEKKRRELDDLKAGAAQALSGYFKLAKCANLIANIDLHIKKSYEAASEEGLTPHEPYQAVGPSVGVFAEPEALKSDEFKFLLTKENFELVVEVELVEARALNLLHLLEKYSEMHVELQFWMETIPGFTRKFDGPTALDEFPTKYEAGLHLRGAQLNRVLAGIMQSLEEDAELSINVTQKFIDAAHKHYGQHFPKLSFG